MTALKSKLAMAFLLSGSAMMIADAASAQRNASARAQQESEQQREEGRTGQQQQQRRGQPQIPGLSREENTAILPLYQAVQAQDWTAATAALPAAQAAARTPAARFIVAQLHLNIGTNTNNRQIQAQAVDAMLASGGAPPEMTANLLSAQATFMLQANNFAGAEAPLTRLLEMEPNNVERIIQLAQVKFQLNKREEGNALNQRALQLSSASGQTPPEALYRTVLQASRDARDSRGIIENARALVRAYPTAENWRIGLLLYRESGEVDGPLNLDIHRLMRAAGALTTAPDFVNFAEELNRGGMPGEVKGVLDEGVRRGVLQASHPSVAQLLAAANSRIAEDQAGLARARTQAMSAANGRAARTTADALFGYGQYAEAAELYRAALQKGGEDANLVNTRLGASLALAGRRGDAETALRAVSGPRAALAQYWLLWLERRPA